jgi:WD40 repeat protein
MFCFSSQLYSVKIYLSNNQESVISVTEWDKLIAISVTLKEFQQDLIDNNIQFNDASEIPVTPVTFAAFEFLKDNTDAIALINTNIDAKNNLIKKLSTPSEVSFEELLNILKAANYLDIGSFLPLVKDVFISRLVGAEYTRLKTKDTAISLLSLISSLPVDITKKVSTDLFKESDLGDILMGTAPIEESVIHFDNKVLSISWSYDSSYLAVTEVDNKEIVFIDVKKSEIIEEVKPLKADFPLINVEFSPDGKYLAASGIGKMIVWDFLNRDKITEFIVRPSSPIQKITWNKKSDAIAIVTAGNIDMWTLHDKALKSLNVQRHDLYGFDDAVWQPSNYIAFANYKQIRLYDTSLSKEMGEIFSSNEKNQKLKDQYLAWNNKGNILAFSSGKFIYLYNTLSKSIVKAIATNSKKTIQSIAWSNQDTYIAIGSKDKTIEIINAKTGSIVKDITYHDNNVFVVSWDRSGTLLASCSPDKTVRIGDFSNYFKAIDSISVEQYLLLCYMHKDKKYSKSSLPEYLYRIYDSLPIVIKQALQRRAVKK